MSSLPVHDYHLIIREHHLDTFGHVNNAVYLEILEEARWELLTQNGFGMEQIKTSGIGPTILEIHIKYLKELRLREKIRIETRLTSYPSKVGTMNQKIFNDQEKLCCDVSLKFGLIDLMQRKLILPTPEWWAALGVRESYLKDLCQPQ
ncbi:MAG TPA: acyl-CoA thioesterase [Candidatus Nitrosotenuis sp.]|jgi:acyl-CoA thioester hydrolase|nr:acyl-CoA thioesterase [Candidatus Nitrosotenuis sp.]